MIITIRHYGYGFTNNENALLLATGMLHHIVWLKV